MSFEDEGPFAGLDIANLRAIHPDHTFEWYVAWLQRAAVYVSGGDMSTAPELPEN